MEKPYLVGSHVSKKTGMNLPLHDSNEVEGRRGYLPEPTVSALSKVMCGAKNSPIPWKSHQVMSADTPLPSLVPVLMDKDTERH